MFEFFISESKNSVRQVSYEELKANAFCQIHLSVSIEDDGGLEEAKRIIGLEKKYAHAFILKREIANLLLKENCYV